MKTWFSVLSMVIHAVPFRDACRRCGLDADILRVAIARVRPQAEYVPDHPVNRRGPDYDVRRVRHFHDAGVRDPVLVEWADGRGLRLVDGWHRYIAAVLREDAYLPVTVRGDEMPGWAMRQFRGGMEEDPVTHRSYIIQWKRKASQAWGDRNPGLGSLEEAKDLLRTIRTYLTMETESFDHRVVELTGRVVGVIS